MEAAMRSDSIRELKGEAFRRLTGAKGTLEPMAAALFAAKCKQKGSCPLEWCN
jgi:hypothetical protein